MRERNDTSPLIIAAECATDQDEAALDIQLHVADLAARVFVLRSGPESRLYLKRRPDEKPADGLPDSFADRRELWKKLSAVYSPHASGLAIRLKKADLLPDVLRRAQEAVQKAKVSYAIVSYRQFTGAWFEFLREQALGELAHFTN